MTDEPTKDAEAIVAITAYYGGPCSATVTMVPSMRRAINALDAHRRAQSASGLAEDARNVMEALKWALASARNLEWLDENTLGMLAYSTANDAIPLAESLAGKIEALERERGRLRDVIERDRTKTAEVISTARGVLASRAWLAEGRGSYEFDDEKYQEEFGAAITEILVALDPLRALAADWSDCPKDYRGARIDWKARAEAAESQLAKRDAEVGKLREALEDCKTTIEVIHDITPNSATIMIANESLRNARVALAPVAEKEAK